jgi:hypothetical protein
MPNQSTASIAPVNLMVLSAGRVLAPKTKPVRAIVATIHDLPGPTVKSDYGFWRFTQFLYAAAPRLSNRRSLRINVIGKIRTREAFIAALDRIAGQKPELLAWWTFSPSHCREKFRPMGLPSAFFHSPKEEPLSFIRQSPASTR